MLAAVWEQLSLVLNESMWGAAQAQQPKQQVQAQAQVQVQVQGLRQEATRQAPVAAARRRAPVVWRTAQGRQKVLWKVAEVGTERGAKQVKGVQGGRKEEGGKGQPLPKQVAQRVRVWRTVAAAPAQGWWSSLMKSPQIEWRVVWQQKRAKAGL